MSHSAKLRAAPTNLSGRPFLVVIGGSHERSPAVSGLTDAVGVHRTAASGGLLLLGRGLLGGRLLGGGLLGGRLLRGCLLRCSFLNGHYTSSVKQGSGEFLLEGIQVAPSRRVLLANCLTATDSLPSCLPLSSSQMKPAQTRVARNLHPLLANVLRIAENYATRFRHVFHKMRKIFSRRQYREIALPLRRMHAGCAQRCGMPNSRRACGR